LTFVVGAELAVQPQQRRNTVGLFLWSETFPLRLEAVHSFPEFEESYAEASSVRLKRTCPKSCAERDNRKKHWQITDLPTG